MEESRTRTVEALPGEERRGKEYAELFAGACMLAIAAVDYFLQRRNRRRQEQVDTGTGQAEQRQLEAAAQAAPKAADPREAVALAAATSTVSPSNQAWATDLLNRQISLYGLNTPRHPG